MSNGLFVGGSFSNTSSAAPAIFLFTNASYNDFSSTTSPREALIKNALLILFDLEELVRVLESETDFKQYIRDKIRIAIIKKEPYKKL